MQPRLTAPTIFLLFVILLSSCKKEKVPQVFQPRNDHEAYENALKEANLLNTALGKDWTKLAKNSLKAPTKISTPYEEAIYVDEKEAAAVGYQFNVKRGQKVQVSISREGNTSFKTFVDLFRIDGPERFIHVASADKEELLLGFEPRRDADYILRFQPELLRGGQFKITIENVPTLSFPVAGKTVRAIGSFWGDARDGGRRKHEGVDIFASRGTPVIAPTDGYVRTAGKRGIGGNVVWLRDSKRPQSLYFAHLNEIKVKRGDRIKLGDTLGTVGNTGNARTTPPHLHFGIYSNGATNPINHLRALGGRLKKIKDNLSYLGKEIRLKRSAKMQNDLNDQAGINLNKDQIVKAIGINADQYKVRLPDGRIGYVSKSNITALDTPLETFQVHSNGTLLKKPDRRTSYIPLEKDESLKVLGKNRDFWLVENTSGQKGWITNDFKNTQRSRRIASDTPK